MTRLSRRRRASGAAHMFGAVPASACELNVPSAFRGCRIPLCSFSVADATSVTACSRNATPADDFILTCRKVIVLRFHVAQAAQK